MVSITFAKSLQIEAKSDIISEHGIRDGSTSAGMMAEVIEMMIPVCRDSNVRLRGSPARPLVRVPYDR